MKYLIHLNLMLLLSASLYGQSNQTNTDTCYSVQLLSLSLEQSQTSSAPVPEGCQAMTIGKIKTVRCGCRIDLEETKKELLKFKTTYPDAIIISTYQYRFANNTTLQHSKDVNRTKLKIDKHPPFKKSVDNSTIHSKLKLIIATFNDESSAHKAYLLIFKMLPEGIDKENLIIIEDNNYHKLTIVNIRNKLEKKRIASFLKEQYNSLLSKKENTDTDLKKAILLFNEHEYKKAYETLQQLQLERLSNDSIRFYKARSAFELGKLDEAIAEYETILKTQTDNNRVRLELARSYYLIHAYKQAKVEFEKVLQTPLPPSVKNNIMQYLDSMNDKEKHYYISGAFIGTIGYDDNIYNNTYLGTTDYGDIILNNDTETVGDLFHSELLLISHNYIIDETPWTIETTFTAYNQMNFDHDDVDIQLLSILSGPTYRYSNYKFLLPIDLEKIWYGSHDYLNVYGAKPKVEMLLNKTLSLFTQVSILQKDYKKADEKDRSSLYSELLLGVNKLLFDADMFYTNFLFVADRKDSGTRVDVSKNIYGASASYLRQISQTWSASAYGGYQYSTYLENDPNLPDRKDNYINLIARISTQITPIIVWELQYIHMNSSSNIEVYSYRKNKIFTDIVITY